MKLTITLTITEVKELLQMLQYYVRLVAHFKETNDNIGDFPDEAEEILFSKETIRLKNKINAMSMNDIRHSNFKIIYEGKTTTNLSNGSKEK